MALGSGLSAVVVTGTLAILLQTAAPTPDPDRLPAATDEYGGFAFSSLDGKLLLQQTALARPELQRSAACEGGRQLSASFIRTQPSSDSDGRAGSRNFSRLAGQVFELLDGPVVEDVDCFLASDLLLPGRVALAVRPPAAPGTCVSRQRFAATRGREVARCWPLADLGTGRGVALLEFQRQSESRLASVVLTDGARLVFADYPAQDRGGDVWRVDDGGRLSPEGFSVLGVLRAGDRYALSLAWNASEGTNLALWVSDGSDRFTRVLADYWYRAPS